MPAADHLSDNMLCLLTIVASLTFIVLIFWIWATANLKGPSIMERAKWAYELYSKARSPRTRCIALMLAVPVVLYKSHAVLVALGTLVFLAVVPAGCKFNVFQGLVDFLKAAVDAWTSLVGGKSTRPVASS